MEINQLITSVKEVREFLDYHYNVQINPPVLPIDQMEEVTVEKYTGLPKGTPPGDPVPHNGMPWNIPNIHSPEHISAREYIERDALYHMTQGEDPSQDGYSVHHKATLNGTFPPKALIPPSQWPD